MENSFIPRMYDESIVGTTANLRRNGKDEDLQNDKELDAKKLLDFKNLLYCARDKGFTSSVR